MAEVPTDATTAPRPCMLCNGAGANTSNACTSPDGKAYPEKTTKCRPCAGTGMFPPPHVNAILAEVLDPAGTYALRASIPLRSRTARGYYVWCRARSHGRSDVALPTDAAYICAFDPWRRALDDIADAVALRVFGRNRH